MKDQATKLNELSSDVQSAIASGQFSEGLEKAARGLKLALRCNDSQYIAGFAESYLTATKELAAAQRGASLSATCLACGNSGSPRDLVSLGAHTVCYRCVSAAYHLIKGSQVKRATKR